MSHELPLVLSSGESQASVDPVGAMVATFKVNNVECLFPDQHIIYPEGPKRRGGIPILFPNAGTLPESSPYSLVQHGFVRHKTWQVKNQSRNQVVLCLESDEETKKTFPFDWELYYTITLTKNTLSVDLEVRNIGTKSFPVAPGFHPYFFIPLDKKRTIETNIPEFDVQAYDWETPTMVPFSGKVTCTIPGHGELIIDGPQQFKKLMLWSNPDKNFVCFEPWLGDIGAMLDFKQAQTIQPNERQNFVMKLTFTPDK